MLHLVQSRSLANIYGKWMSLFIIYTRGQAHMKSCVVRVPRPSFGCVPVPATTPWFAVVPQLQHIFSEPVSQKERPKGCHSTLSMPQHHSPRFAMVPHSPSCNWSLKAWGGTKRLPFCPLANPTLLLHLSWFPVHHAVIRDCGTGSGWGGWKLG